MFIMKNTTNLMMMVALFIIPLTGLSIDVYVPSLPSIASFYHSSANNAQNTISIYILGLGLSQIICGNIIDAYGRRKTLLASLIIYICLVLLIITSKSINYVLAFRFFQGISMGFIAVSARSVFVDLFSGQEYYRKASYMTIAYSIGPIVAPAIGGFLEHLFGWESCFYFMFIYALLGTILVYLYLPETIKHKTPFNLVTICSRYKNMLQHKEYVLNLISLSMLNSSLMVFALVGPFIIQNKLHYSPIFFGQMALLCGLSWFIGNFTNRLLIEVGRNHKITIALIVAVIDLLSMYGLSFFWFNVYVIVIPICTLLVCTSVIFSNLFVHSPTLFPIFAASASAFMAGFFGLLSSGICWVLTTLISVNTQVPLIFGYASLILIIAICHYAVLQISRRV